MVVRTHLSGTSSSCVRNDVSDLESIFESQRVTYIGISVFQVLLHSHVQLGDTLVAASGYQTLKAKGWDSRERIGSERH